MKASIAPPVSRDVVLIMTEDEAKLLKEMMGLNISLPAVFDKNFHIDRSSRMKVLMSSIWDSLGDIELYRG